MFLWLRPVGILCLESWLRIRTYSACEYGVWEKVLEHPVVDEISGLCAQFLLSLLNTSRTCYLEFVCIVHLWSQPCRLGITQVQAKHLLMVCPLLLTNVLDSRRPGPHNFGERGLEGKQCSEWIKGVSMCWVRGRLPSSSCGSCQAFGTSKGSSHRVSASGVRFGLNRFGSSLQGMCLFVPIIPNKALQGYVSETWNGIDNIYD